MPDKPQAVTLDENSPVYTTPDDAADAVSRDFAKQQGIEQAAVVIKRPDGTYGYSTVAPQNTHDSFSLRAQFPKGHSLAGVVHSHPGEDDLGQVFSTDDLNVADQLKVPSFIRFVKDNSIRKYTPGTTKTQSMRANGGGPFGLKVARGDQLTLATQTRPDESAVVARADNDVTSH